MLSPTSSLERPAVRLRPAKSASERRSVPPASGGYLPTLDGWRAVAILGVLVCHGSDALLEPGSLGHRLTRYGSLGVDLFFGISGFLITTRLLQERAQRGWISLGGFYLRRFFRILPPYLTYLVIIGALAACGLLVVHGGEWLSCLLFARNYLPQELGGWYTGHFWSLAVEEHFYLLWPGLLVALGVARARWAVVAGALLLAGWRLVDARYHLFAHVLPGVSFFGRTDIRLDGLLWGCWVAILVEADAWKGRLTHWLNGPVWLVLVGTFVANVACHPPLEMLWSAVLIPLILVGTVLRPTGRAGRLLELSALRWVGRLSYSLYLWQQLFLVGREEARPRPFGILQEWPVNILAVFAAAAASYYLVERPLVRLGHRLARPASPGRV